MLLVLANSKLKLIDTGKGDKDIPDITVSFATAFMSLYYRFFTMTNSNLSSLFLLAS